MKILKDLSFGLVASMTSLVIFAMLFCVWKVDLTLPIFKYDSDGLFYLFLIKSIIDTGWIFSNNFVGLPHFSSPFSLNDFPQYAEFFNLLIVKIFSVFSSNPFLISNCFLIFTFVLIPFLSFLALRSFEISRFSAILVSILYTFLPYHFVRNSWHLFLSNYAIVPLSTMLAMWIISEKIKFLGVNKNQQFSFDCNRYFFLGLVISCFAATNGIYYAFYTSVLMMFAWFLLGLRNGNFINRNSIAVLVFCLAILIVTIYLHIPALIDILTKGSNDNALVRGPFDSEFFALKMINLFLPVTNHYFEYFASLRKIFDGFSREQENFASGLGIIGSTAFAFSLFWLLAKGHVEKNSFFQRTIKKFSLKEKDQNFISNLASLNLLSLLFATVGGLVMFIAVPFPLIRSHARFSIFIAFFSFALLAVLFDKIIEKNFFGKKVFARILVLSICVLALFDQVGRVSASTLQSKEMKKDFLIDQSFVDEIEKSVPKNSQVFILPIFGFPEGFRDNYESLIAYLHSKNLRWSYPAIKGRKSNVWQEKVSKLNFKSFVAELKNAGFVGIYLDRNHYSKVYGQNNLAEIEQQMKKHAKSFLAISSDKRLLFVKI